MARPVRLEFSEGIEHVFARGNRGEAIYRKDGGRQALIDLFGPVGDRFNWVVRA